jgi:hypothetical protein
VHLTACATANKTRHSTAWHSNCHCNVRVVCELLVSCLYKNSSKLKVLTKAHLESEHIIADNNARVVCMTVDTTVGMAVGMTVTAVSVTLSNGSFGSCS